MRKLEEYIALPFLPDATVEDYAKSKERILDEAVGEIAQDERHRVFFTRWLTKEEAQWDEACRAKTEGLGAKHESPVP